MKNLLLLVPASLCIFSLSSCNDQKQVFNVSYLDVYENKNRTFSGEAEGQIITIDTIAKNLTVTLAPPETSKYSFTILQSKLQSENSNIRAYLTESQTEQGVKYQTIFQVDSQSKQIRMIPVLQNTNELRTYRQFQCR
jgi:uncharacterized lipoprotein YehR (DUF1307 family)